MARLEKIYEGKAKIVYATDDPDVYIQDFKDSATETMRLVPDIITRQSPRRPDAEEIVSAQVSQ